MKLSDFKGNSVAREPRWVLRTCPMCQGRGIVDTETVRKNYIELNLVEGDVKDFIEADDWKSDKYEDTCPLCQGSGSMEEQK